MSRTEPLAALVLESKLFDRVVQSFSMYIPYAETTMFRVDLDSHVSATIWLHWAWTALYNDSPVRFAIFAPLARSVVCQICLMSPPISTMPAVDNDFDFAWDRIEPILDNCFADSDVSLDDDAMYSPDVAFIIALTSAADLSITLRLKSLKSCNCSAVCDNRFSRDLIWFSRDEHVQRRYDSFCVAQN